MTPKKEIYCIFVAGGSGTRMGSAMPKQFLDLEGLPVLRRTIGTFLDALPEAHIITVLPRQHFDTWKQLCHRHELGAAQMLVAGGLTRFHSVQNALAKVPDGAIVAIQDGVRPLVSTKLIKEMAEKMVDCRALIPVLPVTDTLRCKDPGQTAPDRSGLLSVQTPQFFLSEDLKSAYRTAFDPTFTDDASVAERSGIRIDTIEGERTNIKITTPEDLVLARAILIAKK